MFSSKSISTHRESDKNLYHSPAAISFPTHPYYCIPFLFLASSQAKKGRIKQKKDERRREKMVMMQQLLQHKRSSAYSWWFDSHKSPRQSPWLLSTLSELEEKTTKMLKLIDEDADSFAQRAEMYYKKRPELVTMVEDFYRAHRSLAEQFDQLKMDNTKTRHSTPQASPTRNNTWLHNLSNPFDRFAVPTPEVSESEESEVDDPEEDDDTARIVDSRENGQRKKNVGDDSDVHTSDKLEILRNVMGDVSDDINDSDKKEILRSADKHQQQDLKLKQMEEELEKLKEENRAFKAQLQDKDEQKREVIRHLSLSLNILKEENLQLKKRCARAPSHNKGGSFDIRKLVFGAAWSRTGRFVSQLQPESRTTLVAL